MAGRKLKQTKTINGSTSSAAWTWKQVISEYWNEDNYLDTNKSIVVVQTYLGVASGRSSASFGGSATTKIDCNSVVRSKTQSWIYQSFWIPSGGWKLIQEEEFEVEHESDGNKTINVSSSLSTSDFNPNSASASGKIELCKIARASKITCPSFNIGDSTVINIERYSPDFKDTITWQFGSLSGTLATLTSLTSIGFTPNKSNFYAQIPNVKSGKGTIICKTYKGSKLIGTSTCEFTAYAVEEKPTVSTTIIDTYSATIALTGDSSKIVKHMSRPKITINATAKNSATIKSYSLITGDGQASTTKETTLSSGISSNKYTASATDSRDYTQSSEITISKFIDYVKCSFGKKTVYRTESASKEIRCDLSGNYFNGSFGSTSNNIVLKFRSRTKNGSWGDYKTVTPTLKNNTWTYVASLGNTFEINTEYEIEFWIGDKLMSDSFSQVVEKGLGVVEIGEDLVNVNGNLTKNDIDVLTSDSNLIVSEIGSNDNGAWIKFANGWMICTNTEYYQSPSWEADGNVFVSRRHTMKDYPQAFVEKPKVVRSIEVVNWTRNIDINGIYDESLTNPGNFNVKNYWNASNSDFYVTYIAIGKFK